MSAFLKISSILSFLFLACASEDATLVKGAETRDLAARVKVCFKGTTRLVPRKRVKYFVSLGATRGPCRTKCCDPLLEPGFGDNPFCREGHACCPDGTWACSIGDGKTFFCGAKQITSGFGEKCPDQVACTLDVKACPDGSFVSRDPALGCAFTPCPPTDPVACTEEAKLCPDGTAVVRDSNNNCEFPPCPTTACTMDAKKCPDGSFVSRNPVNGCQFEECPPGSSARALRSIQCTADVKQCPDGSYVGRDPNNKCRFYPCTLVLFCTDDVYRCPDGSYVSRDPLNNCAFPPCPPGGDVRKLAPTKYCTDDVKKCPDGSYVGRDPKTCKFYPCPVVVGSNCTLC